MTIKHPLVESLRTYLGVWVKQPGSVTERPWLCSGQACLTNAGRSYLAKSPLLERVGHSSVSAKLHRAAVAATEQLDVQQPAKHADSMMLWLNRHGSNLSGLKMRSSTPFKLTHLACPNLQQLHLENAVVHLGSSSESPGVLAVCTALTKLELRFSTVLDAPSGLGNLSLAPAVRHLELLWLDEAGRQATACLPPFILQQLTKLTFLNVGTMGSCTDSLQHISCLTGLQQLSWRSSATAPMLSPSTTPGFQLTALTSISIAANCLDPAALLSCTQLQKLVVEYAHQNMGEGPGVMEGAGGALLSCTARMPQLQQLHIKPANWEWPQAAAAYSALTASSSVTELSLTGCDLPAGVWGAVFPAGRRLPHLQLFDAPLVHLQVFEDAFGQEETEGLVPLSAMSQADIRRLISCCPQLRKCSLCVDKHALTDLAPLTQLTALTKLHVENVGCAALASLSRLTCLEHVFVGLGDQVPAESAVALTALTRLTRLDVPRNAEEGWRDSDTVCVELWQVCEAEPVWLQLLEHCAGDSRCHALLLRSLGQSTAAQRQQHLQQEEVNLQVANQLAQQQRRIQDLWQQQQQQQGSAGTLNGMDVEGGCQQCQAAELQQQQVEQLQERLAAQEQHTQQLQQQLAVATAQAGEAAELRGRVQALEGQVQQLLQAVQNRR